MRHHFLLSAMVCITALIACRKEQSTPSFQQPPPLDNRVAALNTLFEGNVSASTQHFTVSNAGGNVYGAQGTIISFQAGAFLLADGTPAMGPMTLHLVEALTLGHMLRMNVQTVGNDKGNLRLLTTGGALRLTAEQNGLSLRPLPGSIQVTVPFQAAPDPAMALFLGRRVDDGDMVWDPAPANLANDTTGYVFTNDSLGWVNCDYFASLPGQPTTLDFQLPAGFNATNTKLFGVLPAQRVVFNMPRQNDQFTMPGELYTVGLPVGTNMKVAGLHMAADSSLHSSFATFTLSASMEVDLSFNPTTLAAFNAEVGTW